MVLDIELEFKQQSKKLFQLLIQDLRFQGRYTGDNFIGEFLVSLKIFKKAYFNKN